jgi:hypothetical protein
LPAALSNLVRFGARSWQPSLSLALLPSVPLRAAVHTHHVLPPFTHNMGSAAAAVDAISPAMAVNAADLGMLGLCALSLCL